MSERAAGTADRGAGEVATVIDVARQAGVSLATVSRVLNGNATVSEQLREKVDAAVRALEFRPNVMAQGLRRGHSNTVALLVGDIAQRHFAELTMHVQAAVEGIGASLMLSNLGHSAARLEAFLERAPSMRLRAVVIALSDTVKKSVAPLIAELQDGGMAVLSIGQNLTRYGVPSIVHEERAATRRSVAYLQDKGHTRIAYIGRIKGSAIGTERFRGYEAALAKARAFDETLVFDLAFRYAAGRDAVLRALDRGIAFTAIQAGSDEIAMGALAALRDRGLRVPEDVAIVGFGDVEMGAYLRPALTTLSSHPESAARHLGELLSAERTPSDRLVMLTRSLVQRESA
jgi:DNA-binding LacI/PurR family transcriptional regulator